MLNAYVRLQVWLRQQNGQALSEYGMVIALVCVACIGLLITFREELTNVFTDLTTGLRNR